MSASDTEVILIGLEERALTGQLNGFEVEYWVGGGLPPPYYRSEQLRLTGLDGRDVLVFAKSRRDSNYSPPTVVDKWVLKANQDDVRRVTRLLIEARVFTEHYIEEANPHIADILSTEVIVTVGDKRAERRYFRSSPHELAPLVLWANEIIERVQRNGQHAVYHEGKQIYKDAP